MPPVTKKAARAKKQRADCPIFSSLPSPQPEEGSDSEYKGSSGESEIEADDTPGFIVAVQNLYGMFLPANLQAKGSNLTGEDGFDGEPRRDMTLMSKKEQFIAEEVEPIQQDPALEYSLEMGFDLMKHSASLLQDELNDITSIPWNKEFDPDEYLEAIHDGDELEMGNSDLTFGSEDANDVYHESPLAPGAQEWLKDDQDDVGTAPDTDIFKIVDACLRMVKNLRTKKSLKIITRLTAVTQYVKLRAQYRCHPKCQTLCLSASLAIARQMGKGKKGTGAREGGNIARQIRRNEPYLLQHHCLPPSKKLNHRGQYTLLDNEAVIHNVRRYLAMQKLGTITPSAMCRHVNEVIAPTLGLTGPNSHISERTAETWLKKLGYTCKSVRKGIYHDGHERDDVVEAWKIFLRRSPVTKGKNHDANWDLPQLQTQMVDAINIFEFLHPNKVAVFVFDCSSAHEGLAANALK
ncbi:hypothetical protein BDR07DRAFT_1562680 [Suillus spraguei]|nr:hypothetical protein BDR07DRAFT_1562680 [Suillus spraguei]